MNYYTSSPDSSTSGSYFADSAFSSRPESTSPLLSAYPALAKLRHDASRGFDPEDDQEFCPALTSYPGTSHQFGMFTPGLLTPSSPQQPHHAPTTAAAPPSDGIPTLVPRPRQTVEVIDPATGLRVQRR